MKNIAQFSISIDNLSVLAASYPDLIDQCLYDDGILAGPDDVIAELTKKMQGAEWVSSQADWLSSCKQALKAKIDTNAETERLKYITPGTGQAMTYQQKVAEVQAYKVTANPKPEDYPILASEVGITAPTLSEVADTVLAAYRQWQQIGAMIEAVRLGAKRDIDAAENEAAAHAVVDSVVWPSVA